VSGSAYEDPRLAALYDTLNPWGAGDPFYLELVMSSRSVLDLGCGTGQLLRRAAAEGHPGVLVGVDVAAAMLAEAERHGARVEWRRGDARTIDLGRRFELVTMTGHAFQVFLTDDDVRALLANVRRHLEPGGRFAFETRNSSAKAWESWTPDESAHRVELPGGAIVEVAHGHTRTVEPDLVEFSSTALFQGSPVPVVSQSTLRFVDPDRLRALLEDGGFGVEGWFGDWDRSPVTASSPEIVVVAYRYGR
jgi:SAM-dependent methyltransferase